MIGDIAKFYPYRGRIVRIQESGNQFGSDRTPSGHRYVKAVYDDLLMSRRVTAEVGERSVFGSGTVTDVQYRFQTPRYLSDVQTYDELVLIYADGRLEGYNIVTPAPYIGRPGIGGSQVAGYTVILAQIKAAQNADLDIYL